MGRGAGRWQRLLLDALAEYELVPVVDVVGNATEGEPTRAELVAARRAARRLAETNQARAFYLWRCNHCGELTIKPPSFHGRGSTYALILTTTSLLPGSPSINPRKPAWIKNYDRRRTR